MEEIGYSESLKVGYEEEPKAYSAMATVEADSLVTFDIIDTDHA